MQTIASNSSLHIRKLCISDAGFILTLLNQDSWIRFIGNRNIHNLAAARDFIEQGPCRDYANLGFGIYLVESKHTGLPIGLVGFLKRSYLQSPDIGFAISEEYMEQGYGFSASSLLMKYGYAITQSEVIYATVKSENNACKNLLSKLGFIYVKPLLIESELEELDLYKYQYI